MTLQRERVWVGFFILNNYINVETTVAPEIAEAWKAVKGFVAVKELEFDMPSELNNFDLPS